MESLKQRGGPSVASGDRHFLPALALALIPAAWLAPNHYPPWVSAWLDGLALACLALAALTSRCDAALPRPWAWAAGIALASIAGQWAAGRILFVGDALMTAVYVGAFALSIAMGASVARPADPSLSREGAAKSFGSAMGRDSPATFALGTLIAAMLSVAIALVQWTDVDLLRLWIAEPPPSGRPFSNLAQPNHFSTAAFLGLVSLALLREAGHIGWAGFWSGGSLMILGMVMSGSRTAWLQAGVAAAMCAALGPRVGLKVRVQHIVVLVAVGAVLQAAWSPLDTWLERRSDRPLEEKLAAGARPAIWRDMFAAVAREPLAGHGWQQIGAAQQSVALDRPPVAAFFEHFDHAHSVVLDLLLWAGVPVGGLLILLCGSALWRQVRHLHDPRAVWLMIGALGIVAHALLEFPLAFAYFLLPLGVMLGMTQVLSPPGPAGRYPRAWLKVSGAVLAATLAVVSIDYLRAEEDFRLARLETARIGTDRVRAEVPDLLVLTQLESFLRFVRTESRPGMSVEELDLMNRVALRYGFAFVLYRQAVALGLNGRPVEAGRALKLLCHIHSRKRCREAREAWPAMQQRYQALREVPAP